ncbi:MAG: hypothetical protein QXY83_06410, partial [Thermosphaera sp.]
GQDVVLFPFPFAAYGSGLQVLHGGHHTPLPSPFAAYGGHRRYEAFYKAFVLGGQDVVLFPFPFAAYGSGLQVLHGGQDLQPQPVKWR